MKLEISVKTPDSVAKALKEGKIKVDRVLVKPGDMISAGGHIALLRKQ